MRYGRASKVKGDHVEVPMWLIFDARGNVRMTRGEPDTSRHERAMQLTATIPLALFKTPTIAATLTVQAPEMVVPQIDIVAAAEALKGALGCDIDVRLAAPCDRSGEAGETSTKIEGSTEGESAVPEGQAPE